MLPTQESGVAKYVELAHRGQRATRNRDPLASGAFGAAVLASTSKTGAGRSSAVLLLFTLPRRFSDDVGELLGHHFRAFPVVISEGVGSTAIDSGSATARTPCATSLDERPLCTLTPDKSSPKECSSRCRSPFGSPACRGLASA